ncbi:uncharacterized protein LOC125858983 [Solanum stenotomum]|uniref:uncharacterized protein LOC125858983 n=1 Tax=Solanum stenotomum TaxID=172797 RepID=UPI0020D12EB4|nr:uncharacterized protein LOC125858983 [Solanum stenotomum]
MNVADGKFKTLEDFTLEETENIRKELEGRQRAEFEMKEAITSLECRLMEALNTIETMKAEMRTLKDGIEVGGSASPDRDREARVEAPKPPVFKGILDAQEVENFLWHLENYFKCSRVKSDETKINTAVLYLSKMAMLWWRRKEAEIGKGTCTINPCEQFREEFKKAFFPNNVIYEVKRKFKELKQTESIRAYVKEFTTLTLQIPNLTDEDMLFHFMDGLQNWAKMELERRQVKTIDEAITQAESLTDFKPDRHDKAKGKDARNSHAKGGGDRGRGKEQQTHPKQYDPYKPESKRCPEMKNHGAILRERKEKDAQEQGQDAGTTQLGMDGLCGEIAKQTEKPGDFSTQYVDISINGRTARAMVDTEAEANIMTKTAAERLGLNYVPSNTRLKTEFFQRYHTMIDPHFQRLMVMEREGSCMVPLVKVPKKGGHALLSAMQIVKGLKKGESKFLATIAGSREDNGAKESLPPIIEQVLEENKDVMPDELPKTIPPRLEVDHKIELEVGAKPPVHAPYRMAPPELEELRKQLKELLEAGHIRPSEAPYGAPTWTDQVLHEGGPPKRLLPSAHRRRGLAEDSMRDEIWSVGMFVVVYLDDIVIYSNTLEEHVEHLRKVYQVLRENQLYIKREKCEFAQHEVISWAISSARANYGWTRPKYGQSKNGRFIRGYSAKAAPLTELLKKNKSWVWSAECQQAFEGLKAAITEGSVLTLPDFSKTFEVHTDASDFSIGGVLMQERHPIAFESRKLNETEQRYTVQEKENDGHCTLSTHVETLLARLQHDPEAKKLMELAAQGKTRRFWVEDGLLLTSGRRVYVPKFRTIRRQIIKKSHDTPWAEHPGQ